MNFKKSTFASKRIFAAYILLMASIAWFVFVAGTLALMAAVHLTLLAVSWWGW